MPNHNVPVITLDGPSGTGKGTLCQLLARHLKWNMLDSGAIYRVLAYAARKNNIKLHLKPSLTQEEQGEVNLYTAAHDDLSSPTKKRSTPIEFLKKPDVSQDVDRLVMLAHSLNLSFDFSETFDSRTLLDNKDISQEIRSEQCGQDASQLAAIPEVRDALLARQRNFAQLPGLVTDGRDMGTIVFPKAILKIFLYANAEERAGRRYLQLKEKGIDVNLAQVVEQLAKRDVRDTARAYAPLKPAADAVKIDTTSLSIVQVLNNILDLINARLYNV